MKKLVLIWIFGVAIIFTSAVILCVQTLFLPQPVGAFDNGGMRIVVDAGHGGVDGGVCGINTGVKESELNLAIAYCVKEKLGDLGFDVTMTRKTEGGLYGAPTKGFKKRDMEKRKEIIEKTAPVLVLSIHQNLYQSRSVRGGQVFYNANNEKSAFLGKTLQTYLNELYQMVDVKPREAKAGEYFMLQCTSYPSVIVECGFLSNAADEKLLCSDGWKNRLAEQIGAGVMAYLSGSVA
ncbi:MAG: N-acetylmuramoyl-L-alanine amidase [Clostridia bacterium]|nr:N-acetylmuramoyl-L-alanine amidase [Clostridia bacterium]MBQ8446164.1 N-acetylmuramoyl-L-alanine amidase [Clostridia bacterium]